MTDLARRVETATQAARSGAEEASAEFRTPISIETKTNKNDFVSEVDRSVQQTIIEHIESEFPDETIIAEEADTTTTVPESETAWTVDPIDGTANYVHGLPVWSTSVGVVEEGDPISGATVLPALQDSYRATPERTYLNGNETSVSSRTDIETFVVGVLGSGVITDTADYAKLSSVVVERFGDLRRFGCTTAALAFVASGQLDAAITATPKSPWDLAAGVQLIERAGGTVTTVNNNPWDLNDKRVVVSNGHAHQELLKIARDALNDV